MVSSSGCHTFIHVLDTCWALIKYQAHAVGIYVFTSFDLNNSDLNNSEPANCELVFGC